MFCFSLLCLLSIWTHTGDVVCVTDALAEQPVPNLPGEHAGTLGLGSGKMSYFSSLKFPFFSHLVLWDLFDHRWCGNSWFWSPNLAGFDAAGLIVPATNSYNVEKQWTVQGVTSAAQGKFYLVLRRKFHQKFGVNSISSNFKRQLNWNWIDMKLMWTHPFS